MSSKKLEDTRHRRKTAVKVNMGIYILWSFVFTFYSNFSLCSGIASSLRTPPCLSATECNWFCQGQSIARRRARSAAVMGCITVKLHSGYRNVTVCFVRTCSNRKGAVWIRQGFDFAFDLRAGETTLMLLYSLTWSAFFEKGTLITSAVRAIGHWAAPLEQLYLEAPEWWQWGRATSLPLKHPDSSPGVLFWWFGDWTDNHL